MQLHNLYIMIQLTLEQCGNSSEVELVVGLLYSQFLCVCVLLQALTVVQ